MVARLDSKRCGYSPKNMYGSSQLKRDYLKERIARSAYDIDPRQVATAIIVKLALGQEAPWQTAPQGGPSRRAGGAHPDRQAT
jgi:hypothetical protein